MDTDHGTLRIAVAQLLKPILKMFLRRGLGFADISQIIKQTLVHIAEHDLAPAEKKQTTSRISAITGLSRKEVARLKSLNDSFTPVAQGNVNRAKRVIGGWIRDPDFLDGSGKPRKLLFDRQDFSFSDLVKKYSGDVSAKTIYEELERIGVISVDSKRYLRLEKRAYLPSEDYGQEKTKMLGTDGEQFLDTIAHNIDIDPKQPHFQRKVEYSGFSPDTLRKLKRLLEDRGQCFLEDLDKQLAEEKSKTDVRHHSKVGIGVYYFQTESDV